MSSQEFDRSDCCRFPDYKCWKRAVSGDYCEPHYHVIQERRREALDTFHRKERVR